MPATRNFFQKVPFVRVASLFLTGVLISHQCIDLHWVAASCTVIIAILVLLWHNSNYSLVRIQDVLVVAGIILAGMFYPNKTPEKHLTSFSARNYYLAEVCQKPAEKARTFQTILLLKNKSQAKPGKVIAYFSKEKFDSSLSAGDQLIILARPQQIRNAGNPFEFDYKSMMNKKDIWFSVYLSEGVYLRTGKRINRPVYLAERIRDRLVSVLTTALPEKEERSVVSALTLGYRAEIDKDTLDYFASTGAMHVLSVSGLHVALIFMILEFLLSFLKRGKAGIVIFPVVMIALLWFYAFITGFSPSVQRATVMFTFVIVGNRLRRPVNIYNSLTASALFLMLLNPNVIFDIGFQLSYLAVFGIVLIQPVLYKLLEITNPMLKWAWALFTVAVAAQLATFPLGLLYFNQFPNLFWLSNFIVIPATTFITWLTIAFFILSPFHALAKILGVVIQNITHAMLFLLKEIDAIPHSVSGGIAISPHQTIILYGIMVAFLIFMFSKKKQALFFGLGLVILFQSSSLISDFGLLNQKAMYVYNSKNMLIHLIYGRNNYLVTHCQESISEYDRNTVQRVRSRLKLDEPVYVNTQSGESLTSDAVVVNHSEIQFLNCRIKFDDKGGMPGSDVLVLHVAGSDHLKKGTINTTIAAGNSYSDPKLTLGADFTTRQNGAFVLRLN